MTNPTESLGYSEALRETAALTERTLTNAPKIVREYTSHLAQARGKGIRAAALLACSMDDAGQISPDAVRLASAIEILHLATLVHDDVIDDAKTRRGIVTLQKKYGRRTAVICGDYLFCTALDLISPIRRPAESFRGELIGDLSRVCLGELRQHINYQNLNLSVYQYLRIISGKTAALFEAAFTAGAMLLSGTPAELARYRRLGYYTGMIFQLRDDCIDYEESEQTAKKPVRSDFEQGVITLPLIAALQKSPALAGRIQSEQLAGEHLAGEVRRAGGLSFTHTLAEKYYRKARRILGELPPEAEKTRQLSDILDLAFFGPKKRQAASV